MATSFITNTASLKTTIADVRKLNAKKIFVGGENILDIIKSSTPTIKHSQDTRTTITENDLWGQWVETTSDGTIIIHDDWVTNPNSSSAWNTSITKVEDNLAYTSSGFYANIQLEKIKNGYYMFYYCTNLKSFNSDLSSLTTGRYMFYNCTKLTTFSSDLPNLTNGHSMFSGCNNLTSFSADSSGSPVNLSSLTNGYSMFYGCTNLKTFYSDLSSLTYGNSMFNSCTNLKSFSLDLSSLMSSTSMFYNCTKLTTFSSDLSSLTNGERMFASCTNLTSFSSDLPNLTNGNWMFNSCTKLNSFNSDLSSLTDGGSMFSSCKIDAESVMYIADTIKDITAEKQLYIDGTIPYVTLSNDVYSATRGFMSDGKYVYTFDRYDSVSNRVKPYTTKISASNVGKLTLGINVSNNADTIQQQLEDFAQEATFDSWADLKTHFSNKGWTVTFQYGGTSTSITYDLRGGEQIIPCPIFAKLVEADKDSAQYCTEDASSFYNIEWGHDVTDTSSYTQFNSLEDAMASWNVFPKENIITTEE